MIRVATAGMSMGGLCETVRVSPTGGSERREAGSRLAGGWQRLAVWLVVLLAIAPRFAPCFTVFHENGKGVVSCMNGVVKGQKRGA